MPRFQRLDPASDRWSKVDADTGEVLCTKRSPGPYKNVPEAPRPILTDEEFQALNPEDTSGAQERVERQIAVQADYAKMLGR